jgi:DNA-directed RNA polymerase specialized sigma24 family protein
MCKVAKAADYHRAQRRDVRRETPMADLARDESDASPEGLEVVDVRSLAPEDEVLARMEFHRLFAALLEDLQEVFAMRLEGYTNRQIADTIGRSERLVEMNLRTIRGLLRPHLKDRSPVPPDRSGNSPMGSVDVRP